MVVTIVSGVAMVVVDSAQARNTIQVCTFGAMVIIVIRSLNRAEGVVSAALRLAEELALLRSSENGPTEGALASVASLPAQRAKHSEVP
jgi:hypothetical protein